MKLSVTCDTHAFNDFHTNTLNMTKTYAQITREIQALQASAEKMRAAEVKAVVAKINESIAIYGLTADDLRFQGGPSSMGKKSPAARSSSARHGQAGGEVKYSDSQGNVWGGRGPRPAWLRQAIAQGRSLEEFAATGAVSVADSPQRNGGGSGAKAKGKLPPLYGHAKTGQTWSGRGPKPAWLKQALKKRGASIDDFLMSSHTSHAMGTQALDRSPASATPRKAETRGKSEVVKAAAARKNPASKGATSGPATSSSKARNLAGAATSPKATTRKAASRKSSSATAGRGAGAGLNEAAGAKTPVKRSSSAARKGTASTGAKAGTDKASARKAARPRQKLASSMAPAGVGDAASPASFTPAAAPLPAGGSMNPADQGTRSTA